MKEELREEWKTKEEMKAESIRVKRAEERMWDGERERGRERRGDREREGARGGEREGEEAKDEESAEWQKKRGR